MPSALTLVFFEDHFVCTILPNEGAWETLRIDGVERIPLVFHVANGAVRNDDFARERWAAGDPAAFGGFYKTILDPDRPFRRFDLDRPAVQLLHDVLERVKVVFAERITAFDDNAARADHIRVNLCFIPAIGTASRDVVRDYLSSEGFEVANDVDYVEAMLCGLNRKGLVPGKVNLALIDVAFGDVRFEYVEWDGTARKRGSGIVPTRGVDRRIGVLARLLVEKAARQTTSTLLNDPGLLDDEVRRFHSVAAVRLSEFEHDQLDTKVELSDYKSARVRVNRSEVEQRCSEALGVIKHEFERFIGKYSTLSRTEKIVVDAGPIASPEFLQLFQRSFGAGKIVGPLANVGELVSRGVFALSQPVPARMAVERTVEIKITVKTTAAPPAAPPLPPPVRRKAAQPPPLPPSNRRGGESTFIPPPLPPVLPPSNGKATARSSSSGQLPTSVSPPPLPPLPTALRATPGPPRPPLPAPRKSNGGA